MNTNLHRVTEDIGYESAMPYAEPPSEKKEAIDWQRVVIRIFVVTTVIAVGLSMWRPL